MGQHEYIFGELPGHPVGSTYEGRLDAMRAGMHATTVPGISGKRDVGADCIALNGGYVDDKDRGEWVLYTGAGGNDSSTKRQIADQDINHSHNAALVYSEECGLPVRVIRGPKGEKPYAPKQGYRYDGLYKVERHWAEKGRDGFRIWRFLLVRLSIAEALAWTPAEQAPAAGPVGDAPARPRPDISDRSVPGPNVPDPDVVYDLALAVEPDGNLEPHRATGVVQRVVRSTKVAQWVKEAHRHACQVCRAELDLPVGAYSEGAHIRAVGAPHNGPDTTDNMLCLCPNHHVLFDKGGIYIDDDLTVRTHAGESVGPLTQRAAHRISIEHVRYHRQHHGFGDPGAI